jgi:hypothetical protein
MTENDFLGAGGDRVHTGKASPAAQQWADNMTRHYDELALAEPVFGQLRNCMDLAIVAALVTQEKLPARAQCSLRVLLDPAAVKTAHLPIPRQVDSTTSLLKTGGKWIISASGGVKITPAVLLRKVEKGDNLKPIREKAKSNGTNDWWWN